MASNDYDIANLALVRLGAKRITSLSDGSRNANEINAVYEFLRQEVLRSYPWNWATEVINFKQVVANTLTITGVTQANPGVVSYTGTDPEDGDEYLIASVVGMTELNSNYYYVQSVNTTADTFQLYDEDGEKVNTTSYTAYTSGGEITKQDESAATVNVAETYIMTLGSGVIGADSDVIYVLAMKVPGGVSDLGDIG